jgi:hypothetical protein
LGGARHDEQRVAILFDLRSLVGMVRVLDGEIVQLELPLHAGQKRHIRFVQSDPHHMARPAAPARGFAYGDIGDAPAIDIGAGSDDAFRIDSLGRQDGRRRYAHDLPPQRLLLNFTPGQSKASTGKPAVKWNVRTSSAPKRQASVSAEHRRLPQYRRPADRRSKLMARRAFFAGARSRRAGRAP